jgi:hypothetical protein
MENGKPVKTEKKGFDWNSLFSFTSEIAKLALAAGISAYVTESVRNSMSRRREENNVVELPFRKAA